MTIEELIKSQFGISDDEISDSLLLEDIESWDSMNHMILVNNLETHFQIRLTGDQIINLKSVGDIRKCLKSLGID